MRWMIIYNLGAVGLAVLQSLELQGFGWVFRMTVSICFAALALFIYEYRKEKE